MRALVMLSILTALVAGCAYEASDDVQGESTIGRRTRYPSVMLSDGTENAPARGDFDSKDDAAGAADGEAQRGLSGAGLQRKIVYTASIDLNVEDFVKFETDVVKLIDRFGGRIAASQVVGTTGYQRSGSWTLRIPVSRFLEFLDAAVALGELNTKTIQSDDRTLEFSDLEADLKNKRAVLDRYQDLAKRNDADLKHLRQIETDIERVRGEIDRMSGRQRYLNELIAMSTVTLTVREMKDYSPDASPVFATVLGRTFSGSLGGLLGAGKWLVLAVAAAVPWIVVLATLAILARYVWRLRKRTS